MFIIKLIDGFNIDEKIRKNFFQENTNYSKNLTKNEVIRLIRFFKLIKIGNKLYNNSETKLLGSLENNPLKIKQESSEKEINNLIQYKDSYDFKRLEEIEKEYILKVYYSNNNKSLTSRILGISIKTLYNKLDSYGIL